MQNEVPVSCGWRQQDVHTLSRLPHVMQAPPPPVAPVTRIAAQVGKCYLWRNTFYRPRGDNNLYKLPVCIGKVIKRDMVDGQQGARFLMLTCDDPAKYHEATWTVEPEIKDTYVHQFQEDECLEEAVCMTNWQCGGPDKLRLAQNRANNVKYYVDLFTLAHRGVSVNDEWGKPSQSKPIGDLAAQVAERACREYEEQLPRRVHDE